MPVVSLSMDAAFSPWQHWTDSHRKKVPADLWLLADCMLRCDARLHARMSYGVPFVYRNCPIGYFNFDKKLGWYFGFYWGKLLLAHDAAGLFHADERKMVKLVFFEGRVSDEGFLGAFLALVDEALRVDAEKYGKKP